MPQKIQPIGFWGRREATRAPTVGYTSSSIVKSTSKPKNNSLAGIRGVRSLSSTPSSVRATETAHTDHANHAAERALILPIPRLCWLAPSVTTLLYSTAVFQALRQTLRSRRSRTNFREWGFSEVRQESFKDHSFGGCA